MKHQYGETNWRYGDVPRLFDDARSAGYSTRYNLEAWGMRPGLSTLTLEFPRLQIEDRSRLIDVSKIKAVYFFSAPVKQPVEYYIGPIRLEPAPQADKPLPEGFQAFDFGSDGSSLWPGFAKVTPSMAFDEERGFGFLSSVPLSAQDLGVPDPLARDAVSGNVWRPYEYGFAVKVKPGRYGVRAIARHIGPDRLPTRSGSITAESAEVYRREIAKEVFYSDEILYRGLSRPYRLDQDAYAKFFSPDLDWHRFEVEVSDERLNLIFENLAVFALAVYPIDQKDSAEKRLAEIYSDWPQQLEPALKEMNQLAVQASRSIQSHFADFLFDPFNQGLQGMLTGFVNTVRRMLAEAVARLRKS